MLYTCTPDVRLHAAAARAASRKVIKRGKKSFAVDLHCHVHTPAADEIAKQTAVPAGDPVTQHGSQRTADRQHALR